jgi:hypothetical protein
MLFRNFLYQPALEQLGLAVKGGSTEEGLPILGMSITDGGRAVEYYYTYGLALARTNECGEALRLSQQIQAAVPTDENAVFAAEEMVRICQENLENPPEITDVPTEEEATEEPTEEPTVEPATETPSPEPTEESSTS